MSIENYCLVNLFHHIFQLILIVILKVSLDNFVLLSFFFIQGQTKYWHNRRCTSSSLVDNSTEVSHTEPKSKRRSR